MRRLLMLLIGTAGCYSPSVATGVPCAPVATGSRCPANQVCILRGGIERCEAAGTSDGLDASTSDATADAPMIDAGVPADWWNVAWSRRRPIDVTAGTNGLPARYSVSMVLDHAALVGIGASLASGTDVRVVRDAGAVEVDRTLDTGSAWNSSTTTLWFQTSAALAPGSTVRYWVYHGNLAATAPPQDPMSVFMYADGLEGSLAAWSFDAGVGVSTARAHRGARSIAVPPVVNATRSARLTSINESNVAFDVWWNIDDLTLADMSQYVRGNSSSAWFTNLQPPAGGGSPTWDIAKVLNGTYSEVVPPPSGATSPSTDTWFRVTVYAYANTMAVDMGGTRYVPTSGFFNIGTTSVGDVGFGSYNSAGQAWFDDVSVRRFVVPEPIVVLGASEILP